MLNVAVIGYGYWGPNLVRNFARLKNTKVTTICDSNDNTLIKARNEFPEITATNSLQDVIRDEKINIVAIATPVSSHFEIAKEALLNNKHVFIEKPFTASASEAEQLIEIGYKKNLIIMVDHTFLFSGAVRAMKNLISTGELGKLHYIDSTRVNLGLFQHDVNVIWDLAPHDFSIMNFICEDTPKAVMATGFDHFKQGLVNIAYCTVYFDQMIAHFNLNWMSPVKIRKTLIGGSKKMIVWDDISSDEKIRIYDKGVTPNNTSEGIYKMKWDYRLGNVLIPQLDHAEPLFAAVQHFSECIVHGTKPISCGEEGLKIVKLLEACNRSMEQGGKEILV